MSYEPKTWECGDTITAEALNHLEQGVANAGGGGTEPLIVHAVGDSSPYHLDKTYAEIHSALLAGTPLYFDLSQEMGDVYDYWGFQQLQLQDATGDNDGWYAYVYAGGFYFYAHENTRAEVENAVLEEWLD